VIARERALEYGGATIEAIPHVRDEILRRIEAAANEADSQISVIEIGGTVGDFQNALFIEAARLLRLQFPEDVAFVMVSYLPVPGTLGEMKTKPTQSAVRELNSYGVQPDFIVARSTHAMDEKRKEKLAIACSVRPDRIISAPDVESIYDVPVNFERDNISDLLLDKLRLSKDTPASLSEWKLFVEKMKAERPHVKIGIVGKYFDTGDYILSDAYLSIIEALKFSGAATGVKPDITWLNAKDFEKGADIEKLSEFDGILVPGGFGESGIEGKLKAIQFARENKIPYFGICYGMQLMVIEYARNVLGLKDAHTTEINPDTANPIVAIMDAQKKHMAEKNYGGTMRLGSYVEVVKPGTIAYEAYGTDSVEERHRHRYEINPAYVKQMEDAGMVFSATSPDGVLMEVAELPREVHPFMLGTQAHPELQARPLAPHPLFTQFLKTSQVRAQRR
jgi:CTP synthase